jgi:hypothetical protein
MEPRGLDRMLVGGDNPIARRLAPPNDAKQRASPPDCLTYPSAGVAFAGAFLTWNKRAVALWSP